MAQHLFLPVDFEVPVVVVFSSAELSSKHKLVDTTNWHSENTRVIFVARALVHQNMVEDDWVELDVS